MIASTCFADSQIQIYSQYDTNGVLVGYFARSFNGKDNGWVNTQYTIPDAQATFGKLLDPATVGTSMPPDRVFAIYDSNGNLIKIDAAVFSHKSGKDNFEKAPDKGADQLSAQALQDAANTKTDVETKTGKDIKGDGLNGK